MSIKDKLRLIKKDIPDHVKLVAVSKFHTKEAILEAYDADQRIFGESRMQELIKKQKELPADIEWHFIGNLQTNKVKNIIPYVNTIHSVDSWKLLQEIEKQASTIKKRVNCLLEIHIAQEESKFGFSYEECRNFLSENQWQKCIFANITGVMGMASNTDNEIQIRNEFKLLKKFFEEIKNDYFYNDNFFADISMGMSYDYKIAIDEGSTMVRIGSSIFGERTY